jgi:hypothetical protein
MRLHPTLLAVAAVSLTLLAGCGSIPITPVTNSTNNYYDTTTQEKKMGSLSADDTLFSFGRDKNATDADTTSGGALGVNAYLWRASLETLSFMPLASADPFGGVIITDWYQPPQSGGERFKATAYILGKQLRADGVRVTIYRQVQQGGQWVDATVAPSTAAEIENKVLARARELRVQSAGS